MGHYVVRLASVPELDGEMAQAGLSVTSDDGRSRDARVLLVGHPALDARTWTGVLTHAVEEIEFGFKGETWGVALEDGAPLLIEVDEATAGRLAVDAAPKESLEAGAVIGEFDA
jgi:hypothetical protein